MINKKFRLFFEKETLASEREIQILAEIIFFAIKFCSF